MDTLALLCNLHAEGPTTLRKLRELGCSSIDELTRLPQESLALVLAARADAAQRFVHEGRLLHERFAPEPCVSRAVEPARSTLPEVAPEPEPELQPLVPGAVDGLDHAWCQALVGQGILSLEQLVDAPGLALARSLRLPFTQLLELQCLARRRLAQRPTPSEREVLLRPQRAQAGPRAPVRATQPLHERPVVSHASARPSPGSGGPFSDILSDRDAPGFSREFPHIER